MIIGSCPISFIKGEAYLYKIKFDDNVSGLIEKVCISSSTYNFCHNLTKSETSPNEWEYLFLPTETENFNEGRTTYSLTVHSSDPKIDPQILTNQQFEVRANDNPCCDVVME